MIEDRLRALGFLLPEPKVPNFQYVPVVVHQSVAYVSGQLPWDDGRLPFVGHVGRDVDVEAARRCARLCVVQALAGLKGVLGSLEQIDRILKVTGFVASAPDFHDQPKVVDAASQLLVDLLGEAGRHARSAIGVASLPRQAPVEIEFIVAVRPTPSLH
ncbi:MAG: RidA family protein [Burkholderiales bacterium]